MAEETEKSQARLEELYSLATKSEGTPKPKRALLAWKCPKCSGKLTKESVKEGIMGESEFARKVISEAGVPAGLYYPSIDHFTCGNCGYEFAKRGLQQLSTD